ncbi:MAG: 2-oxoacid:ferredoxin oxidoreductase subunit beta [Gammaproteobacteria bacterium]|jgi:2-oxoglutarate ferredoxin oxidoreductase subunit beta
MDGIDTRQLVLDPQKANDFKGKVDPDWCAGCGDFGVLNSLRKACLELGLKPHEILTISGIGCSSNFPGFFNSYGMHTLHGRSLAVATGAKMANHELTVVVTGGDGDGYGIGGNHFTHTARRNVDLTYIVMDNEIYGLTTGQVSPTSALDMKTKSTPFGSVEFTFNPVTSAIMNGATFVARGFSSDTKHLSMLMQQAIEHRGFSLLSIFSPCITFNHDNNDAFFKPRVKRLEDEDHDTSDWKTACEKALLWGDTIYTGLFLQVKDRPSLDAAEPVLADGGAISRRALGLSREQGEKVISRMM